MSKYIIQGGKKLSGIIRIVGNKNAVLPIMAASLLVDGDVVLTNVPHIQDVMVMREILIHLGANVTELKNHELVINTNAVSKYTIPTELSIRLRASVLLLGSLYARFGVVSIAHPGGDIIGKRSIQTHLDAFQVLGARITNGDDVYQLSRERAISNNSDIFLDEPSVTGTENAILATVLGSSRVTIANAAREPHIVDLIHMLIACGADIAGVGTDTLIVTGKKTLHGCEHVICPDYLEAGTFAVLGAINQSPITLENVPMQYLRMPFMALERMGVQMKQTDSTVTILPSKLISSFRKIQAGPYPQFPTDLMSPFIVLATQAEGETLFHDPMYESRMFFVDKLIRMGARITICDPHRVIVNGQTQLIGRKLASPDIRAGMTLVLAALIARGESEIDMAEIIERGYERIDERLRALGAEIVKIE